jgi:hypothetical protein
MNRRERILAIAVGGLLAVFVSYSLLNGLLIRPSRRKMVEIRSLRTRISKCEKAVKRQPADLKRLDQLRALTLNVPAAQAENRLFDRLNTLVGDLRNRGGIAQANVAVSSRRRRGPGGAIEITCSITAQGGLRQIVDLLYLLHREPYLNRIEALRLRPQLDRKGRGLKTVAADVDLVALVLPDAPGRVDPAEAAGIDQRLAALDRQEYDDIVKQNIFLPYTPMPQRPAVARQTPRQRQPTPQPQRSTPTVARRYKLVGGLTTDPEEFGLLDVYARPPKTQYYKPGDKLPRGSVAVMMETRYRANPNRPGRTSPWRIIVRVRDEYWAVEAGEYLSQRHRMKSDELPERLLKSPTTQPVAGSPPDRRKDG